MNFRVSWQTIVLDTLSIISFMHSLKVLIYIKDRLSVFLVVMTVLDGGKRLTKS